MYLYEATLAKPYKNQHLKDGRQKFAANDARDVGLAFNKPRDADISPYILHANP